jgi:hypothetical protein
VKNCATSREPNNLPTPLGSSFPPCGRAGLTSCNASRYCKPLETKNCPNGSCLGICVPFFSQKTSPAPQPGKSTGKSPARPPPSGPPQPFQMCPSNFQCPSPSLCVTDPRGGGSSYMCIVPNEICGGYRRDPCYNNKLCMRDPRLNCEGEGCPGICV